MMLAALRHPFGFVRDHRFTRSQASAFLDGDLDADGRRRVERHTHACPPCARLIATLRRTVAALNALSATGEPSVTDGILARLRGEGDAQEPPSRPDGRDLG